MSREEWRPVAGWEGCYEVSSRGRVRSVDRIVTYQRRCRPKFFPGTIRKTHLDSHGYHLVELRFSPRRKRAKVHLLVCEAFHGPRPYPDWDCRHLNGIKTDNRAENLTWGTKTQNAQDTLRHGKNFYANKTHCPSGHEYTPENTRLANGGRSCRECSRTATRRSYRANPEKTNARAIRWAKKNRELVRSRSRERYRRDNPGAKPRGPYNTSETHCKNGHVMDEANTYVSKRGYKNCRACHRQRQSQRRKKEPA